MRIRVHLPRLADLAADSVLRFEMLDGRRRIAQRGAAVPAALPKSDGCEVVLHPFDVLLTPVRLPKLAGARLGAALPGLVEDRLAGDAEQAHVVATPRGPDGDATAAVVDRILLGRALALLARAGLRVVTAEAAPLALPEAPGRWRVHVDGDVVIVRTGRQTGTAFPATGVPPRELALLLTQESVPAGIDVSGPCDVTAWSAALSVAVRAVPVSEVAPEVALDLLQYGFAVGIADGKTWHPTAWLALALVIVFVGGLQFDAWRLRHEERTLRTRMAGIVVATFPEVPVVLDPVAQMQRLVADLAPGADRGGFVDLVTTLGRIADSEPLEVIDYRDGVLAATFRWPAAERDAKRDALMSRAAAAGVLATGGGDAVQLRRKATQ